MTKSDVRKVVKIIRRHSADDGEAAGEAYDELGLDGQYVLEVDGKLLGATGARYVEGTDGTWWMSWTVLDPGLTIPGIESVGLISAMLDILRQEECRKVFVEVSNMDQGPAKRQAYGRGQVPYEEAGFRAEMRHRDYYDYGEDVVVLSCRLEGEQTFEMTQPNDSLPRLVDIDEIPETNDAYVIDWEFPDTPPSNPQDLKRMLDEARGWGARVVFASAGSDCSGVMGFFRDGGFAEDGRLADFYEDGIDEIRLRMDLKG